MIYGRGEKVRLMSLSEQTDKCKICMGAREERKKNFLTKIKCSKGIMQSRKCKLEMKLEDRLKNKAIVFAWPKRRNNGNLIM